MKKCLECSVEFEPDNPKGKFCSPVCRQKNYRKRKTIKFKELLEIERESRNSGLINAARGRDESGVNEDEGEGSKYHKVIADTSKEVAKEVTDGIEQEKERGITITSVAAKKLEAFEKELPTIPSIGAGKQRIKFLEKQIQLLKQQLK